MTWWNLRRALTDEQALSATLAGGAAQREHEMALLSDACERQQGYIRNLTADNEKLHKDVAAMRIERDIARKDLGEAVDANSALLDEKAKLERSNRLLATSVGRLEGKVDKLTVTNGHLKEVAGELARIKKRDSDRVSLGNRTRARKRRATMPELLDNIASQPTENRQGVSA